MELRQALRSTGAARRFTEEPVDDRVIVEILDDARHAPSGGNRQPWRVAIVGDRALRRRLADLMQPVWNEYVAASKAGQVPFNSVDYRPVATDTHARNPLLDEIETIPVVLVIAADMGKIVATDAALDRAALVPGASVYPFCWSLLLSARAHGLGGVMTTMIARVEPDAGALLRLPERHALAATVFLGHPVDQPTKLTRADVSSFASVDGFAGDVFG
jgi:nitroreductase